MSCNNLEYKGRIFSYEDFKAFVENNPEQFDKYLNPNKILGTFDASIDYNFKSVDVILSNLPKVKRWESSISDPTVLWTKIQRDLGISKAQVDLISVSEGDSVEEKITNFLANYAYTVEIETTKEGPIRSGYGSQDESYFVYNGYTYEDIGEGAFEGKRYYRVEEVDTNNNYVDPARYIYITKEEFDQAKERVAVQGLPANTQTYSNLTVPGGTNYTENEIKTPQITPNITGHAEFATKQGIGWFRSDEQVTGRQQQQIGEFTFYNETESTKYDTKTRRILEVQSDLFQKGRGNESLIPNEVSDVNKEVDKILNKEEQDEYYSLRWSKENGGLSKEKQKRFNELYSKIKVVDDKIISSNNFLQLLNKDNNWVTFFIKSIIQDSARKGYEKVLFPSGNTANKIEGQTELDEYIRFREEKIADEQVLLDRINNKQNFTFNDDFYDFSRNSIADKSEDEETFNNFISAIKSGIQNRIDRWKHELNNAEQGNTGLARINKFYEKDIQNILKKRGYNPTRITDEYGNDWYEVQADTSYTETISLDSSISDLEQGLRNATANQQKFENQLERLLSESGRVSNVINQIKEESIRSKLRDSLKYIKDEKKEVKNFIYFLLEAQEVLKFYSEDLKKITNKPIEEAVHQLDNAMVISRAFKDTITFLKKDFSFVDSTNEFKQLVDNLSSYYDQIQTIYATQAEVLAFKFIADELSPDAKLAYDSLKAELDTLEAQLAKAVAAGSSDKYRLNLQDKIEEKKKQIIALVPDASTVEETFKGLRGDLNWFTGNFRSTLAMGDPVVSGYARRLKRGYNEVRARLNPIRNNAQVVLERYMRATGHTTTESMETFYEGLFKKVTNDVYDEEGILVSDESYHLLSPIEQKFYNDDAKYRNDIKQAKKTGDLDKIEAAQKAYSEWLNKYAERRYSPEWYNRYDLLTPAAYEARQGIIEEMNAILRGPNRDNLSDADYDRLHDLKQQKKTLGSLYDNGVLKTGEALAIAQSIQAFNKETARMSTWEITPENRRWFEIIVAKKKDQVAKGLITQEQFDTWFANNTQRNISPEFYKQRQVILDKIQAIMSKLPKQEFREDMKELWTRILDVSRPYRDDDNILVGDDASTEERAVIRDSEESIEELKAKLVKFSGLTIEEEQELSGLWGSLDTLTAEEIRRFVELRDKSDAYKEYLGKYISKDQFSTLMMAFNELAAISKYEVTTYYTNTYKAQLQEFKSTIDPADTLTLDQVEPRFKQESQWFKDNHVKVTRKVFDDGNTYFIEEDQPLYIWRDLIPTNEDWIEQDAPGFAFKTQRVKPEFINSDYEALNFEYFRASDENEFKIVPKRNVDGKISSYISEDYERLSRSSNPKDVERYNMLRFLTDTHLVGQQLLPRYKRLGYGLPGVQKTTYDRAREQGLKGIKESVLDTVKVTQEDRDLTLGDISQIDLSIIPVKFSTKVPIERQDLDLLGIILKHRMGVEEYSYLEQELPYAKVIQSALKTAPGDVSETQIQKALKATGLEKFIKATKESQRSKTFESFLRTMFYGETEISPFNSDTWNKRINSAFGLATLQVMMFNFPAHITNIISGEVQNVIESSAGRYMTMTDYRKAKVIYGANIPNFWNDYGKEGNKTFWSVLADKLDVPQGEFIDNFGKKTRFSRLRDLKNHVMFIKQGGEHEIQVSALIAMSINKKVKLNDQVISLKDALELKNGEIRIKEGVTRLDNGQPYTEADLNVFQDQVHAVVRQLNGAYAKIDKSVAEKSFLGKLAFYMRKYFLPMAYRRFEPYKYDYEERAFKEGYYVTGVKLISDMFKLNADLVRNWSTYKETLTDDQKRNVRRFMTEVGIIVTLGLVIMMIGGDDDDREFKGRWFYTMAVYELMKVKSETETFLPLPGFGINELTSLFSSPFVPATTAKTAGKVLTDLKNAIVQDEDAFFKRDYGIYEEGDLRLKASALKMLGVPVNLLSPELLVKNFELRNR